MDQNEDINENYLVELGDSDYEIADGEPNIKGWDVKNEQGEKIGEVDELLFDPQTRKVRYIIVDLDDNELELDEDKKVLIPIGIAEIYDGDSEYEDEDVTDIDAVDETSSNEEDEDTIAERPTVVDEDFEAENERIEGDSAYQPDEDGDVVIVPITNEQLSQLPAYEKGNITPESETAIRNVFSKAGSAGTIEYNRNEFYDHEHFNTEGFYDRGATMDSIVPDQDLEPETGAGFGEKEFSGKEPGEEGLGEKKFGEDESEKF